MRVAGFTVVALVTVVVTVLSQQPIAIGIVRDDGYLMPITRITPQDFEVRARPEQTFINGEPIGPAPFPAPEWPFKGLTWTLSSGRGRKPVEITTLEPVMVDMPYCEDRLLWRTTLKRPPVDQRYVPIGKIGLAVRGAAIEHPEVVANQPDPGSRRVARRIVALFLSKERARLAVEKGQYAVSAAPGSPPVRIKQLSRHLVGDVSTYYFEATKALTLSDGAIDPNAGLITGWIVDSPSGLKDYEVTYKVNDDAYKENDHATVHGIVPFQGRALWLLEWHGWEWEYYTLHEWPAGVARLTVDAYQC
jgi:hypothetical protein